MPEQAARSRKTRNRSWWWLVLVLLVCAWLGARGLDADMIWSDESYQIRDARVDLYPYRIIGHVAAQNPWHVPGYFLLLNPWGRLFTWFPAMVRVPALFFGLLGVAFTYRLGTLLVNRRVGLAAAAILAVSGYYVHYLHEVRMYSLTAALTALALWLYLHIVYARHRVGPGWYVAYGVCVVAMLYTHYFLGIVLVCIGLYHILFAPKRNLRDLGSRWWRIVWTTLLAGLTFVPWLPNLLTVLDRTAGSDGQVVNTSVSSSEVGPHLVYLLGNGSMLLALLTMLVALVPLWRWRGGEQRGARITWFFAFMAAAIILAANEVAGLMPLERMRYALLLWPLFALVVALAVEQLARLPVPAASALAVGGLGLWLLAGLLASLDTPTQNRLAGRPYSFPMHAVLRDLRALHQPGDYVLGIIPDDDLSRRYDHGIQAARETTPGVAVDSGTIELREDPTSQAEQELTRIEQIGPDRQYVWVAYPVSPVPTRVEPFSALLSETYAACGAAVSNQEYRVDEFARSVVCCTPDMTGQPPLATFGDHLRLTGLEFTVEGNVLRGDIAFAGGDQLPPDTYSVGLHITDAQGNLVAQTDYGLTSDNFACEPREVSLAGLPPGDYTLNVVVYNWQTSARLPTTVGASPADAYAAQAFTLTGTSG